MSAKSGLRSSVSSFLHRNKVRRVLENAPVTRRYYRGWARTHPIDKRYGFNVDTSGFMSVDEMGIDASMARHMLPYAGSQPSIIRRALGELPKFDEYSFVDLGCGKGRPLLVASEFPFHRVTGVELSFDLVKVARANAMQVRRRHPDRPPIDVLLDNAIGYRLPAGKVVLFFYHSFGRDIFSQLVEGIERDLADQVEHLFIIYYNPVCGDLLDESPALKRWHAETMPYASEEVGFGPDREDTVVMWQSVRGALPRRRQSGSDLRIRASSSRRAELVS